jgi:hypothetical protein
MKTKEKNMAIELRKKGLSLGNIARQLKVSKGSVSVWTKNVKLTKEQKSRLKEDNKCFGNTYSSDHFRQKRLEYQKEGEIILNKFGYEFLCGCVMYWAEGTKNKSSVSIINSDPYILKYFVEFLKKFFNVNMNDIKVHCTYYNEANVDDIENYWSSILSLPKKNFWKSTKVKSMRSNYEMGMCRVNISSTRIVQNIYGALQSHFDFHNEKWLG